MSNGGLISGSFSSDTTLSTPVAINKGGTGQTTAQAALDALAAASGTLVQGDIFIVDSSGNMVRLARGSDDEALVMNGNNPNWETAGGATVTVTSDTLSGDDTSTSPTFSDTSLSVVCQSEGKFITVSQLVSKIASASDGMQFRYVDDTTELAEFSSSQIGNGVYANAVGVATGTSGSQTVKMQFANESGTDAFVLKGSGSWFSAMVMMEVS